MAMNKDKQKLIGREMEMAELRRCMESDRSEFVIVYGRRRVGKTFLVDRYFNGDYDFSFVGRNNQAMAKQLRAFAKSLKKYARMEKQPVLKDWFDAFDALEEYLESLDEDRKKVVFIDEMDGHSTIGIRGGIGRILECLGRTPKRYRTRCQWLGIVLDDGQVSEQPRRASCPNH